MNTRQIAMRLLQERREATADIKAMIAKTQKTFLSQLPKPELIENLLKTLKESPLATHFSREVESVVENLTALQAQHSGGLKAVSRAINLETVPELCNNLGQYAVSIVAGRIVATSLLYYGLREGKNYTENLVHFIELLIFRYQRWVASTETPTSQMLEASVQVKALEGLVPGLKQQIEWLRESVTTAYDSLMEITEWSHPETCVDFIKDVATGLQALSAKMKTPVEVLYRKFITKGGLIRVFDGGKNGERPDFPDKTEDHNFNYPCECHTSEGPITLRKLRELVTDIRFVYSTALRGPITTIDWDTEKQGEVVASYDKRVWVALGVQESKLEGQLMNHCGDSHVADGFLVSCREGTGKSWFPRLTAVLKDGYYYYCYGKGNAAVKEADHPDLIQLMKSPYCVGVYAYNTRDHNVWLDFTDEQRKEILAAHEAGKFIVDPGLLVTLRKRAGEPDFTPEEWEKLPQIPGHEVRYPYAAVAPRRPAAAAEPEGDDEEDNCHEDGCQNEATRTCALCEERFCPNHTNRCRVDNCPGEGEFYCDGDYDHHREDNHSQCDNCERDVIPDNLYGCAECQDHSVCGDCRISCSSDGCDESFCSDDCASEHMLHAHTEPCGIPSCGNSVCTAFTDEDMERGGVLCSICSETVCFPLHGGNCPLCTQQSCSADSKEHLDRLHMKAFCVECDSTKDLDICFECEKVLCPKHYKAHYEDHLQQHAHEKENKKQPKLPFPEPEKKEPAKAESSRCVAASLFRRMCEGNS